MTDAARSEHPGRRRLLLALALLCALPALAAWVHMALGGLLQVFGVDMDGPARWVYLLAQVPYLVAARWVLRYPLPYVASSVASLLFSLLTLRPVFRDRRRSLLPLALILLVVFLPIAYRYRPALTAAPGYRSVLLTPVGFPDSVTRAARVALETRYCDYTLLGWYRGELYYQKCCGAGVEQWAYDPTEDVASHRVTALPEEWDHTVLPRSALLERLRAPGVSPASAEPATRAVLLQGEGIVSHDNWWTACISQHLYGPQDVLVLTWDVPGAGRQSGLNQQ